MMKKRQGFIHVYTDNGKGKTTAALGLAVRATGAGLRVCFIQFLKGGTYAEHKILKQLPGLVLKQYGRNCLFREKATSKDIKAAQKGLAALIKALASGEYDVVIADEICVAQTLGLIKEADVLAGMCLRPPNVELILTGCGATSAVQRRADLVTVMQGKKHYYQQGVMARKGIEY